MAKVTGPLGSFSATGKVGKMLVYGSHLGRNVVRSLVIPANPQTGSQGDTRLFLGAVGRAAKIPVIGGLFLTALKPTIPAGQTWVSTMVKYVMGAFADAEALDTAYDSHTNSSVFQSVAEGLGISSLTVSYATSFTTLPAGAILYAIAVYADSVNSLNPGIFGESAPWDEPLADWDSADISAFATYLTNDGS
jgi:hypothetical protein